MQAALRAGELFFANLRLAYSRLSLRESSIFATFPERL